MPIKLIILAKQINIGSTVDAYRTDGYRRVAPTWSQDTIISLYVFSRHLNVFDNIRRNYTYQRIYQLTIPEYKVSITKLIY